MGPLDQTDEELLRLWSQLRPGEQRRLKFLAKDSLVSLRRNGLRLVGGPGGGVPHWTVEPLPSWLLPPVHPRFRFRLSPAPDVSDRAQSGMRYTLWDLRNSNLEGALQQVLQRARTSWWVRWLPETAGRLPERLLAARPVMAAIHRICKREFGLGYKVVAVILTGSYLWAEQVSNAIDASVVIDHQSAPDYRQVFRHLPEETLLPQERPGPYGTTVRQLDLLAVGMGCLERPSQVRGRIGSWLMSDGEEFPYDLHSRKVLAAVRETFAMAGVPVYGPDIYARLEPDPANLLALAYYFTQEASALLAFQEGSVKAARRLLESQLILASVEEGFGNSPEDGTSDLLSAAQAAVRRVAASPSDPYVLADLRGWHGREGGSLLDSTVRRLLRIQEIVSGSAPPLSDGLKDLRRRLRRAIQLREPGWRVLVKRLAYSPLLPEFARLFYVLGCCPTYDQDRWVDISNLGDLPWAELARRPEQLLAGALLQARRYQDLLPRSDHFARTPFPEAAAEFERALDLCSLVDGFLCGIPVGMWLGDPFYC